MNVYELVGQLVSKIVQRFSDALVILNINRVSGARNHPEPCEWCEKPSTGFYVIYEWDEELQTSVTVTGAYLCDECKTKYGYEE